jgi:hypothetical protein
MSGTAPQMLGPVAESARGGAGVDPDALARRCRAQLDGAVARLSLSGDLSSLADYMVTCSDGPLWRLSNRAGEECEVRPFLALQGVVFRQTHDSDDKPIGTWSVEFKQLMVALMPGKPEPEQPAEPGTAGFKSMSELCAFFESKLGLRLSTASLKRWAAAGDQTVPPGRPAVFTPDVEERLIRQYLYLFGIGFAMDAERVMQLGQTYLDSQALKRLASTSPGCTKLGHAWYLSGFIARHAESHPEMAQVRERSNGLKTRVWFSEENLEWWYRTFTGRLVELELVVRLRGGERHQHQEEEEQEEQEEEEPEELVYLDETRLVFLHEVSLSVTVDVNPDAGTNISVLSSSSSGGGGGGAADGGEVIPAPPAPLAPMPDFAALKRLTSAPPRVPGPAPRPKATVLNEQALLKKQREGERADAGKFSLVTGCTGRGEPLGTALVLSEPGLLSAAQRESAARLCKDLAYPSFGTVNGHEVKDVPISASKSGGLTDEIITDVVLAQLLHAFPDAKDAKGKRVALLMEWAPGRVSSEAFHSALKEHGIYVCGWNCDHVTDVRLFGGLKSELQSLPGMWREANPGQSYTRDLAIQDAIACLKRCANPATLRRGLHDLGIVPLSLDRLNGTAGYVSRRKRQNISRDAKAAIALKSLSHTVPAPVDDGASVGDSTPSHHHHQQQHQLLLHNQNQNPHHNPHHLLLNNNNNNGMGGARWDDSVPLPSPAAPLLPDVSPQLVDVLKEIVQDLHEVKMALYKRLRAGPGHEPAPKRANPHRHAPIDALDAARDRLRAASDAVTELLDLGLAVTRTVATSYVDAARHYAHTANDAELLDMTNAANFAKLSPKETVVAAMKLYRTLE